LITSIKIGILIRGIVGIKDESLVLLSERHVYLSRLPIRTGISALNGIIYLKINTRMKTLQADIDRRTL
jgi:hypothetical protein